MKKRNVILFLFLFTIFIHLTLAYELCDETISKDELNIISIIDSSQNSEAEWIWTPSEKLNIEVTIENKNLTTRNFQLELFFLDTELKKRDILTSKSNTTKTISLDKEEKQTLNFSLQLDNPNQDSYYLYAKLYEIDNESICRSLRATSEHEETNISIAEEEKIIIVRNIEGPTNITAGSKLEYTAEVINLGNIKEPRVLVIIYNANLKIREEKEIIDLGVEEKKNVTFNITIPQNATLREENFLFSTEYDYDNETGFYHQSNNKDEIFSVRIESTENQTTKINENQTTEISNNSNQNTSTPQTQNPSKESSLSILWAIIPLIIAILIGVVAFFLLRKKEYIETPSTTPSAASTYVKNIQNSS